MSNDTTTTTTTINHNAEAIVLRMSIAHIVQAVVGDSSPDLGNLPPVIGKGAAELYVLARDHQRGWNSLTSLAIHEIQHLQMMLAAERKDKESNEYIQWEARIDLLTDMHEREIKEKDAIIAQLSEDNEYLQELLNNRWDKICELRDELASAERSYERLRNVNVALGSANTSASNEIERLRARILEARRVLDI